MSVVMEAPVVVSRRAQFANLFTPAWSVPRNDSVDRDFQPRPTRRRFKMKKFTLLSIKQVKSHESTTDSIPPAEIVLDEPVVVLPPPDEDVLRAVGASQSAAQPIKPPSVNDNRLSNGDAGNPGNVRSSDGVLQIPLAPKRRLWGRSKEINGGTRPAINKAKTKNVSGLVVSPQVGPNSTTNPVLSTCSRPANACAENSAADTHKIQAFTCSPAQATNVSDGQNTTTAPTTSAIPSQTPQSHILKSEDTEAAGSLQTTLEFLTTSKELYSPEKGLYVKRLGGLSLTAHLEHEWRDLIQPKLMRNLLTALASLPKQLSRAERSTEIELCMSGRTVKGDAKVTLEPTIWLRCGSKPCLRLVQKVVTDLSISNKLPVHVTLHAPRPANSPPLTLSFQNGSDLLPMDTIDEIQPLRPPHLSNSAWVQNIGGSTIKIYVQSLSENRQSVCGLGAHFIIPTGLQYVCTVGGVVLLGDTLCALTTAHLLWDPGLYTEEGSDTSSESQRHLIYGPHYQPISSSNDDSESTYYAGWTPATLLAASYKSMPITLETTLSSASDVARDFALLCMQSSKEEVIQNLYWDDSKQPHLVNTISSDLTGRDVSLLWPSAMARRGRLLDEACFIVDHTGCWETRKISLGAPLGRGASGTWVVDDSCLLGIIIAVYDDEPFAHMLPIQAVFSSIESVMKQNIRLPRQKLTLNPVAVPPSFAEAPKFYHLKLRETQYTGRDHSILAEVETTKQKGEAEKRGPTEATTTSPPGSGGSLGLKPLALSSIRFASFAVSIMTISWEIAMFPLIMSRVTDAYNSLHLVSWYGTVYLLGFSFTLSLMTGCHKPMIAHKVISQLITASGMLIFGAGAACSLFIISPSGYPVGRALCGSGAAAVLLGIVGQHHHMRPAQARNSGVMLIIVHGVTRLVSPIIAAVLVDTQPQDTRYEWVGWGSGILASLSLLLSLAVFEEWPWPKLLKQLKLVSIGWLSIRVLMTIICFGAYSCILTALYFGTQYHWRDARVISIFTAGVGPSLLLLATLKICCVGSRDSILDTQETDFSRSGETLDLVLNLLWGAAFYSFTHFYPMWLQTVRQLPPIKTSISYIPLSATYLLGCVPAIIFMLPKHASSSVGLLWSITIPIVSLSIMSLAAGLSSRLSQSTSSSMVIGLQFLFGFGAAVGLFLNRPRKRWEVSLVSRGDDDAIATQRNHYMRWLSRYISLEMIGGCFGIAAVQAAFATQLSNAKVGSASNIYKEFIMNSGATTYQKKIPEDIREQVIELFGSSLTKTFYTATAAGAIPVGVMFAGLAILLTPPVLLFWYFRRRRHAGEEVEAPRMYEQNYPVAQAQLSSQRETRTSEFRHHTVSELNAARSVNYHHVWTHYECRTIST